MVSSFKFGLQFKEFSLLFKLNVLTPLQSSLLSKFNMLMFMYVTELKFKNLFFGLTRIIYIYFLFYIYRLSRIIKMLLVGHQYITQ